MSIINLLDEQDKTIDRLKRLLQDRNEEIADLRSERDKARTRAETFLGALSGIGLTRASHLARYTQQEAFEVGTMFRQRIETKIKEETSFLRRRKTLNFVDQILTEWKGMKE